MPAERDVAEFGRRIQSEVVEKALGSASDLEPEATSPDFRENVFTELVIEVLAAAGVIEDAETCYYERQHTSGNVKVNGWGVHTDETCLDLFVAIFSGTEAIESITKTQLETALAQLTRFFLQTVRGAHMRVEESSDAYAMMSRIWEVGDRIERVRLFVLSDGRIGVRAQSLRLRPVEGYAVSVQVWDVERIYRCTLSDQPREAIEIDFEREFGGAIPCLAIEDGGRDFQGYLAVIPGDVLYQLYDDYGARLLELNVRSFLQAKGKVNRGIRDTLRDEPDHFFAFNNGISATADELTLGRAENGALTIRAAKGLQIVNGGQTTASIHRAKREEKRDLREVLVPAKLTVVRPELLEEMVPKISRFANSQNKVSEADFSANDPYHVELQKLSETVWVPGATSRWFYERARGQYQVAKWREGSTAARRRDFELRVPSRQVFTKTDLAKFVNSWDQLPHVVSRGNQKNFVEFMIRIRDMKGKDWRPDLDYYKSVVAMAILFRTVERIVRREKLPAYRANVTTYTVAYLSYWTGKSLDLRLVWEEQELSSLFDAAIANWVGQVNEAILETAAGRNVTEWCKKEECWRRLRSLKLGIPNGLAPDGGGSIAAALSSEQLDDALTEADLRNVEACMEVSADEWLRIHAWGKNTGSLQPWQYGIAHTLSGYAACEWDRRPSAKQARHAVAILEAAREQSIVDAEEGSLLGGHPG